MLLQQPILHEMSNLDWGSLQQIKSFSFIIYYGGGPQEFPPQEAERANGPRKRSTSGPPLGCNASFHAVQKLTDWDSSLLTQVWVSALPDLPCVSFNHRQHQLTCWIKMWMHSKDSTLQC